LIIGIFISINFIIPIIFPWKTLENAPEKPFKMLYLSNISGLYLLSINNRILVYEKLDCKNNCWREDQELPIIDTNNSLYPGYCKFPSTYEKVIDEIRVCDFRHYYTFVDMMIGIEEGKMVLINDKYEIRWARNISDFEYEIRIAITIICLVIMTVMCYVIMLKLFLRTKKEIKNKDPL